jgi:hypothetical protein
MPDISCAEVSGIFTDVADADVVDPALDGRAMSAKENVRTSLTR